MNTFAHSIEIRAGRAPLFGLTQDYGRRLEWDPFLKEARLVGAEQAGPGVRAWCVAKNGLGMETEYVSFSPPAVTAMRMTRGPKVFASFAGSWRFEETATGTTRVTFRYSFSLRPRWLAPLLNPVFAVILSRETAGRLAALKRAVEVEGILSGRTGD